jgi:hypothetical protein
VRHARHVARAKAGRAKKNGPIALAIGPSVMNCVLARLAGFEPTTPWFVAKYSIQLSYSREAS